MKSTDEAFLVLMEDLGSRFARGAPEADRSGAFVRDNYAVLKQHRVFSATVPTELGGGGVSHRAMARGLRILARHCGSTSLALSMHQHLVAFQLWNHFHGKPGRAMLEAVAARELVLVSTGARDWLASGGSMERVQGGYLVSARKPFASGVPAGDLAVTSSRFRAEDGAWQVLHFPVSLDSAGVRIEEDWDTLGMRGTGSHTLVFENVFVPGDKIALARPAGRFHAVFHVIVTVALPYITAAYLGLAEAAVRVALDLAKRRRAVAGNLIQAGEMKNDLTMAELAWESLLELADNLDFEPGEERTDAVVVRKSLVVENALAVGRKAMELAGGIGYFRSTGLERILRDLHAGPYHPLPLKQQQAYSGARMLGQDPASALED